MLENKDMDERNAQTRYPDSVTMTKLYPVSKQLLEILFICQVFFFFFLSQGLIRSFLQ